MDKIQTGCGLMNKSWFILELFTDLPEDHSSNFINTKQDNNIVVQVDNMMNINGIYRNEEYYYVYKDKLEVIHIES